MKTKAFFSLLFVCALPLLACGLLRPIPVPTQTATSTLMSTPTPPETETLTPTPDLCLPENLPDSVKPITDLQARFDYLSGIAANAKREQLPGSIPDLQKVLEIAQQQETPPCLETLRDHQLKHMNLVIEALTAFADHKDQKTVDDLVNQARQQHEAYQTELTQLVGATPSP